MSLTTVLFSFSGRINRRQFWLQGMLPWVGLLAICFLAVIGIGLGISAAAGARASEYEIFIMILWLPFAFFLTYVLLCIYSKRWHDLGRSGMWNLFLFIPILGFFAHPIILLTLGIRGGQSEENDYGPVPL